MTREFSPQQIAPRTTRHPTGSLGRDKSHSVSTPFDPRTFAPETRKCDLREKHHEQYAAELIDRDGEIYKFDDVACMLRYAHSHAIQQSSAKFYVMNYARDSDWIDDAEAYFVRLRSTVSSPMASGIVAFRNAQNAATASSNEDSLTFQELWSKEVSELNRYPADCAKR
jgi:hypothetical protein